MFFSLSLSLSLFPFFPIRAYQNLESFGQLKRAITLYIYRFISIKSHDVLLNCSPSLSSLSSFEWETRNSFAYFICMHIYIYHTRTYTYIYMMYTYIIIIIILYTVHALRSLWISNVEKKWSCLYAQIYHVQFVYLYWSNLYGWSITLQTRIPYAWACLPFYSVGFGSRRIYDPARYIHPCRCFNCTWFDCPCDDIFIFLGRFSAYHVLSVP